MAESTVPRQKRGWCLPYLLALDAIDVEIEVEGLRFKGMGRWRYWFDVIEYANDHDDLLPDPIPQVNFAHAPYPADVKHVKGVLNAYVHAGLGGYEDAWIAFTYWLLHGFGRRGLQSRVEAIPEEIRDRWYREFNLARLLHSPVDWPAFVLQGGLTGGKKSRWASATGFFATPIHICTVMAMMLMPMDEDPRVTSTFDPCAGTGSMLLAASNYSLRLYGQDIVPELCLAAELNGWLWIPWLVFMPAHVDHVLRRKAAEFLGEPVQPTPVGVNYAPDDPETVRLAERRREQAEALQRAAREGELEQLELLIPQAV